MCKIEEKDQAPCHLGASDTWRLGELAPCPLSPECIQTGVPVTPATGLIRWPLRQEFMCQSLVSVERRVLTTRQSQERTQ